MHMDKSNVATSPTEKGDFKATEDISAWNARVDVMRLAHGDPTSAIPTVKRRYPCDWATVYNEDLHAHHCTLLAL